MTQGITQLQERKCSRDQMRHPLQGNFEAEDFRSCGLFAPAWPCSQVRLGGQASCITALAYWPVRAGLDALKSWNRKPRKELPWCVSHLPGPGIQEGLVDLGLDLTQYQRWWCWSLCLEQGNKEQGIRRHFEKPLLCPSLLCCYPHSSNLSRKRSRLGNNRDGKAKKEKNTLLILLNRVLISL